CRGRTVPGSTVACQTLLQLRCCARWLRASPLLGWVAIDKNPSCKFSNRFGFLLRLADSGLLPADTTLFLGRDARFRSEANYLCIREHGRRKNPQGGNLMGRGKEKRLFKKTQKDGVFSGKRRTRQWKYKMTQG